MNNFDYYIFGGIKPLSPTTINRRKKEACIKSNIRPIQLREFRRSHASLLYDIGTSMQLIKNRLGHSEITTTMKYYVDVEKNKEKRLIKSLNFIRLLSKY